MTIWRCRFIRSGLPVAAAAALIALVSLFAPASAAHARTSTSRAAAAADVSHAQAGALPAGCKIDPSAVDYPGAVDCIVPTSYDCNISPQPYPNCTYVGADRPHDYGINGVVIHDVEGSAAAAIATFQNRSSAVSVAYVVGADGTVYQILPEKDIEFGDGNCESNLHTIQIENAGFDATGYQWYNAAEYQGSARLLAYLLKKYHLPLDRADIPAHATVPGESYPSTPAMHVDPGPYWLWDYYFRLAHQQGVPYPATSPNTHIIKIQPRTADRPFGHKGTETPANFNFFYLYNGPSTASGLIPQLGNATDVTDVTNNVEAQVDYYYLNKVKDPAGTGDTMYEIWYGEIDQAHASPPSFIEHAHLAWLAVPPGDAVVRGTARAVTLTSPGGGDVTIYGAPVSTDGGPITSASVCPDRPSPLGGTYEIGTAPSGATFASGGTVLGTLDGAIRKTNIRWYEINYNHRQGWVPASEVSAVSP